MKVSIGADHRGFEMKRVLAEDLRKAGHAVEDRGTHTPDACDYPDIAKIVARDVASGRAERGILICMSGIGMAIAANKVGGVRAGLCHSVRSARLSREHNDANVLVIAAGEVSGAEGESGAAIWQIAEVWIQTRFEGGRHERRVQKIAEIEKEERQWKP